jgi:hypothetical protein
MREVETSSIREELRMLVDHIPSCDIPTARKILRSLVDPLTLALLNAPPDDEPLSEHEKSQLAAAEERERRGDPLISHEEILAEFGLDEPEQ